MPKPVFKPLRTLEELYAHLDKDPDELTDSDIIANTPEYDDRAVVLALYRNMRRGLTPNTVPNMAVGRGRCKALLRYSDPHELVVLVQANPELGLAIAFFKPENL